MSVLQQANSNRKFFLLILVFCFLHTLKAEDVRRRRRQNHNNRPFSHARSGNFCPRAVTRMVSCQVQNGTETYQSKVKVGDEVKLVSMKRPRFVNSFKEVKETTYGCCPGFKGDNCDDECYNCVQLTDLFSRVRTLESKLRIPSTRFSESNSSTSRTQFASRSPRNKEILMGPPDTSHVANHPLNGGRGRNGVRNGRFNGRRNGARRPFVRRRNGNGLGGDLPRSDIDIVEDGGTDAYDEATASTIRPFTTQRGRCVCPPGPPGLPGIPGVPGAPGVSLPSNNGETVPMSSGIRGLPGPPGLPGTPGPIGERSLVSGPPGPPGRDGFPGSRGPSGSPGVGVAGPKGQPGLEGLAGRPGSRGEDGIPGIEGRHGVQGEMGIPGLQGPPGKHGHDGLNGYQGPKGDLGSAGLPGSRGLPGPSGPSGPPGGSDGILYDEDGVRRLKGEKGAKGVRGVEGPLGPKGERGFDGVRGFSEGGVGSGGTGITPEAVDQLFRTIDDLRVSINLLDSRIRAMETELPRAIGYGGGDSGLREHEPNYAYEPRGPAGSAGPGAFHGNELTPTPEVEDAFSGKDFNIVDHEVSTYHHSNLDPKLVDSSVHASEHESGFDVHGSRTSGTHVQSGSYGPPSSSQPPPVRGGEASSYDVHYDYDDRHINSGSSHSREGQVDTFDTGIEGSADPHLVTSRPYPSYKPIPEADNHSFDNSGYPGHTERPATLTTHSPIMPERRPPYHVSQQGRPDHSPSLPSSGSGGSRPNTGFGHTLEDYDQIEGSGSQPDTYTDDYDDYYNGEEYYEEDYYTDFPPTKRSKRKGKDESPASESPYGEKVLIANDISIKRDRKTTEERGMNDTSNQIDVIKTSNFKSDNVRTALKKQPGAKASKLRKIENNVLMQSSRSGSLRKHISNQLRSKPYNPAMKKNITRSKFLKRMYGKLNKEKKLKQVRTERSDDDSWENDDDLVDEDFTWI